MPAWYRPEAVRVPVPRSYEAAQVAHGPERHPNCRCSACEPVYVPGAFTEVPVAATSSETLTWEKVAKHLDLRPNGLSGSAMPGMDPTRPGKGQAFVVPRANPARMLLRHAVQTGDFIPASACTPAAVALHDARAGEQVEVHLLSDGDGSYMMDLGHPDDDSDAGVGSALNGMPDVGVSISAGIDAAVVAALGTGAMGLDRAVVREAARRAAEIADARVRYQLLTGQAPSEALSPAAIKAATDYYLATGTLPQAPPAPPQAPPQRPQAPVRALPTHRRAMRLRGSLRGRGAGDAEVAEATGGAHGPAER